MFIDIEIDKSRNLTFMDSGILRVLCVEQEREEEQTGCQERSDFPYIYTPRRSLSPVWWGPGSAVPPKEGACWGHRVMLPLGLPRVPVVKNQVRACGLTWRADKPGTLEGCPAATVSVSGSRGSPGHRGFVLF